MQPSCKLVLPLGRALYTSMQLRMEGGTESEKVEGASSTNTSFYDTHRGRREEGGSRACFSSFTVVVLYFPALRVMYAHTMPLSLPPLSLPLPLSPYLLLPLSLCLSLFLPAPVRSKEVDSIESEMAPFYGRSLSFFLSFFRGSKTDIVTNFPSNSMKSFGRQITISWGTVFFIRTFFGCVGEKPQFDDVFSAVIEAAENTYMEDITRRRVGTQKMREPRSSFTFEQTSE